MPVGLDWDTMLRLLCPQCEGIWRPPELGSSLEPTALRSISSGVTPEGQAQGAIAVVRVEPVVSGFEGQARSGDDGLVAGAADLKEDQALTFELDFLVVELPRQHHRAVGPKQFVARQAQRAAHCGRC